MKTLSLNEIYPYSPDLISLQDLPPASLNPLPSSPRAKLSFLHRTSISTPDLHQQLSQRFSYTVATSVNDALSDPDLFPPTFINPSEPNTLATIHNAILLGQLSTFNNFLSDILSQNFLHQFPQDHLPQNLQLDIQQELKNFILNSKHFQSGSWSSLPCSKLHSLASSLLSAFFKEKLPSLLKQKYILHVASQTLHIFLTQNKIIPQDLHQSILHQFLLFYVAIDPRFKTSWLKSLNHHSLSNDLLSLLSKNIPTILSDLQFKFPA